MSRTNREEPLETGLEPPGFSHGEAQKWQRINNVAVETALDAALRLITKLSVTQVAEPLGISRKLFVGTEATAWVSGSVKNLDDSTTCFFCA